MERNARIDKAEQRPGGRLRLGVIVLSTNLTVEEEFRRMVPEGVSFHISRCPIRDETVDEREKERAFLDLEADILDAARRVAMTRPDLILFACTVGSFLDAQRSPTDLSDRIREATGRPGLTTSQAVLEALRELGIQRLTLFTPYPEAMGVREKAFLERMIPGLRIVSMRNLGIVGSFEKNFIPPAQTYRLAKEIMTPDAQGLFLSCTALPTMEIIDPLEKDLGLPVITSTQASLWAALRRLQVRGPIGYGRLLAGAGFPQGGPSIPEGLRR